MYEKLLTNSSVSGGGIRGNLVGEESWNSRRLLEREGEREGGWRGPKARPHGPRCHEKMTGLLGGATICDTLPRYVKSLPFADPLSALRRLPASTPPRVPDFLYFSNVPKSKDGRPLASFEYYILHITSYNLLIFMKSKRWYNLWNIYKKNYLVRILILLQFCIKLYIPV